MKLKDLPIVLGKRIKSARWQREMTQKELAKMLKCAQSHMCEIEKGKKLPSLELLLQIECTLGTTIWGGWE